MITLHISPPCAPRCDAIVSRDDDDHGERADRGPAILETGWKRHSATLGTWRRMRSKKLSSPKCAGTIFLRRLVSDVSAELGRLPPSRERFGRAYEAAAAR
jgi:hypothetical protein